MTGDPPGRRPKVQLTVNGEAMRIDPATTVSTLVLDTIGANSKGVAVAVDGQVVPRSAWESWTLSEGAQIEIVTAAAGG